ncbi:MAG: hypothetical protein K8S00_01295 [Bacteroidales bacterium]|nr:hypothetical protein [Bacteroidales bacterium]
MSKIIYLDQNKWIDIARAFYGREDGEKYHPVLEKLQEKVNLGDIIVPISAVHIIETARNGHKDRRERLANFIAELSKSYGILPYISVRQQEIENSILLKLGKTPKHNIGEIAINRGVAHMLGMELPKNVFSADYEKFLIKVNQLEKFVATMMIDFISRELVNELKQEDIDSIVDYEKSRQLKNEELSKEMRLRVAIMEMAYDRLFPVIIEQLKKMGIDPKPFADSFKDIEDWKGFFFSMPTMDIWINLHVLRDSDKGKAVHRNDTNDMAFLSIAVPYCDIVVTEKYWAHHLISNGYDKKYNTTILTDLTELTDLIK